MKKEEKAEQAKGYKPSKPQLTTAQQAFKGVSILTARPEGMKHEEYRIIRNAQQKFTKDLYKKEPNKDLQRFTYNLWPRQSQLPVRLRRKK